MRILQTLFRYTLNNVIFGIALLACVGLYIAIGSGLPSVREYFELSDLQFFNAWPLKVLLFLMCVTLATVTTNRIPLTPPRYGVWCLHTGIVTLVVGMSVYYHFKVEGKTLLPIGHTVAVFYDSSERALYARVVNQPVFGMQALPSLPRFAEYDEDHDEQRMQRDDLCGIDHFDSSAGGLNSGGTLSQWLGVSKRVSLDIVAYYPYADVVRDSISDSESKDIGVELTMQGAADSTMLLTNSDPTAAKNFVGNTELEHRNVSSDSLALIRQSARQMFHMTVSLPNRPAQTIDAQMGGEYKLAGGYRMTIQSLDPEFPMFGTHELVRAITLHIVSDSPPPKREFWRMVLEGKSLQTDFKMDPATTPPFVKGNRQKAPIDADLVLGFTYSDAAALMPEIDGDDKHTFCTTSAGDLVDIHTSYKGPTEIRDMKDGDQFQLVSGDQSAMVTVRRAEHFRLVSRVVPTAPQRRVKEEAESGIKQAIVVRVTCGDWSELVAVPCSLWAAPEAGVQEPMMPWSMGTMRIPGANAMLQLQLGFTARALPAALSLRNFEMIHYPGGEGNVGLFRDFRSTLDVLNPDQTTETDLVSLNSPAYYHNGAWIFFQAGYDPSGQVSTIGVGNRPGVRIVITGCGLIAIGLMYAFYIKPILIRRKQEAALSAVREVHAAAKES